jgi:hypothetical protein
MKKNLLLIIILALSWNLKAQIDTQKRFQSDSRKYYVWSFEHNVYELQETEYEHSVIDIREIGSKSNGYLVLSMTDNGLTRLQHGSISSFTQDNENEGTWLIRSKYMKGKLTYNPQKNTMTYLYDSNDKRYNRLIVFTVAPDSQTDLASIKGQ